MKLVETAQFSPGHCAVTGEAEGPFLDLEVVNALDERIYLRPGVVQQGAKILHLFDKYEKQVEELQTEINRLKQELSEADRELDGLTIALKKGRGD